MELSTLNLATLPLKGFRLIEASAGTGKTYSIATLYCRLLLGLGATHTPQLTVHQILVVTFTKAATEELRHRIRERIRDLRQSLEAWHLGKPLVLADETFNTLIPADLDGETRQSMITHLRLAEQSMDESAIYTIDSFSIKIAKEYALLLKQRLNTSFVQDERDLQLKVVRQFWRTTFSPLTSEALVSEILSIWSGPEALLNDMTRFLNQPLPEQVIIDPTPLTDLSLTQRYEENNTRKIELLKTLKTLCQSADLNQIQSTLESLKLRIIYLPEKIATIMAWAADETVLMPYPTIIEAFTASALLKKAKENEDKIATIQEQPLFSEIEQWLNEFHQIPSLKSMIFFQVFHEIQRALLQEKDQLGQTTHGDALRQLNLGLKEPEIGPLLSKTVAEQFPVAMIDEFQDTNELQYSLFHTIYKDKEESCLLMIGDPKQAIYRFRGGDIFTYLKAKDEADAIYTMETNWRSSDRVVQGTNELFQKHFQSAPNGSEPQKNSNGPFLYKEIPYIEMASAPHNRSKAMMHEDLLQKGMVGYLFEGSSRKEETEEMMAKHCASTIAQWLTTEFFLVDREAKEGAEIKRRVQAKDITLLVRTGKQAKVIQDALLECGLSSVFLSDKSSVYKTEEARWMALILEAVLHFTDIQKITCALSVPIMNESAASIDRMISEGAFEECINEFKEYYQTYLQKGPLVMFRQLMKQRNVIAYCRSHPEESGDRLLTNFMHLSELLQVMSEKEPSLQQLINEFNHQRDLPDSESDAHQERLESSEDLIKVMTIHGSKGLEFNLVYLPFIAHDHRKEESFKAPYIYHDESYQRCYTFDNDETIKAIMKKENDAETLRLFYVAVTRAIYQCVLGVAKKPKKERLENDTVGLLLTGKQTFEQLCTNESPWVEWQFAKLEEPLIQVIQETQEMPILSAAHYKRTMGVPWRMTSYSGLSRYHHVDIDEVSSDKLDDELIVETDLTDSEPRSPSSEVLSIHTLPRGRLAGTEWHTLIEGSSFQSPLDEETIKPFMRQLGLEEGSDWPTVLIDWFDHFRHAQLIPDLCLAKVVQHRLDEFEFMFPIREAINGANLNQVIKKRDPLSQVAGSFQFSAVKGMLKGFIDLVFEYEGKYYLADYKSNYLGDSTSAYTKEAMEKSIIEHRYDLQYQIYTLALHRYLKQRLGDDQYDYETHFGGVFYLFLRGMEAEKSTGVYFTKPSWALIEALDHLFNDIHETTH